MDYSKTEHQERGKKQSGTASLVVGWLVFTGGFLIIAWTLLNSYSIFTLQVEVSEFFTVLEVQSSQEVPVGGIEEQLQGIIQDQLKGLIPANTLPTMLNLGIWSMLAFILIFGGSKIADLGIKLIKNAKSS